MLLQQITSVSFFLLALSSLCQVSGYRYRPRQEDLLVCELKICTSVIRTKVILGCEGGTCIRKVYQYVNDKEVAVIEIGNKRNRQPDACEQRPLFLKGLCMFVDEDEMYMTHVSSTSDGRWVVAFSFNGTTLNCQEIENLNPEPNPCQFNIAPFPTSSFE